MIILETTSYIIMYLSQKVNNILKNGTCVFKRDFLGFTVTHTFNICNRLTVVDKMVNIR